MNHRGLNQLLCAALVNDRFRDALLADPAQAVATGYFDQSFSLTSEEQDMVVDIRAQRLEDFAAQVYRWISGDGSRRGNGRNGNGHRGNGYRRNGHRGSGHMYNPLDSTEPLVDRYRASLPA